MRTALEEMAKSKTAGPELGDVIDQAHRMADVAKAQIRPAFDEAELLGKATSEAGEFTA